MKEWYASFKKSKWFPLAVAVLSVLFGILCLTNPQIRMETVALYVGIAVLCYGVFWILAGIANRNNKSIFVSNLVGGVILTVAAVFILANLALIGKYLPSLVGFVLILSGIHDLFRAFVLLKNGLSSWWMGGVVAVIVLIIGFVFLLSPGFVGSTIGIFTGVALIINGVSNLINFVQFKK